MAIVPIMADGHRIYGSFGGILEKRKVIIID